MTYVYPEYMHETASGGPSNLTGWIPRRIHLQQNRPTFKSRQLARHVSILKLTFSVQGHISTALARVSSTCS